MIEEDPDLQGQHRYGGDARLVRGRTEEHVTDQLHQRPETIRHEPAGTDRSLQTRRRVRRHDYRNTRAPSHPQRIVDAELGEIRRRENELADALQRDAAREEDTVTKLAPTKREPGAHVQ